jgi:hypothetical protein
MGRVVRLPSSHVLAGVWAASDSSVRYSIRPKGASFEVSAVDSEDGEALVVSNIAWDGSVLRFTSLCPSTGWQLEHVLELTSTGAVSHRYTRQDEWLRVEDE